jgi:copper resistance protein B
MDTPVKLTSTIVLLLLISSMVFGPSMARADAEDDPILAKLMLDELETRGSGSDSEDSWDAQAWLGKDLTKLWVKTEGERAFGETEDTELQFLYSTAVAAYWDFQIGVRHDFKPSPNRTWVAIGFQGLAPYFFEIDTALFIGESGRTALRFEAEYELLLTQRLILTPEIEMNLYGKNDPAIRIGSGLSGIEAGLRLRYEIRRQFAPYIGVNWTRLFGNTADFAKADGANTSDTQFTIGLRAWF